MLTAAPTFSGYSVTDLQSAKKFYGTTLGITVEETPMGLSLKTGSNSVFLYQKPNHQPATFTVLNFVVDDVESTVKELKEAGVVFEHYEGLHQDEEGISWGAKAGMGPNIAWFKDPAGNILSVLNEGE